MEQILEREGTGSKVFHIYDDYGKEITNPVTLRAIRESDEIYEIWKQRLEE